GCGPRAVARPSSSPPRRAEPTGSSLDGGRVEVLQLLDLGIQEAGGLVRVVDRRQRRDPAVRRFETSRAARVEGAARRDGQRGGHVAADHIQAILLVVEARYRLQEADRVRMLGAAVEV